jgi:hypothetical protein
MTDEPARRAAPVLPPRALATAGATGAAFAGIALALGLQMREGRDPALGATVAGAPATATTAAPAAPARRKVVVRRVIVDVVRAAPATAAASPTARRASAPATAPRAAAPAPAPAPPPAPAPVVTRAS